MSQTKKAPSSIKSLLQAATAAETGDYRPLANYQKEVVEADDSNKLVWCGICRCCRQEMVLVGEETTAHVRREKRRGICRGCYEQLNLRDDYCAKQGGVEDVDPLDEDEALADALRSLELPEPTDAPAGSDAKCRVLEERARLGQALWNRDFDPWLDTRKVQVAVA